MHLYLFVLLMKHLQRGKSALDVAASAEIKVLLLEHGTLLYAVLRSKIYIYSAFLFPMPQRKLRDYFRDGSLLEGTLMVLMLLFRPVCIHQKRLYHLRLHRT